MKSWKFPWPNRWRYALSAKLILLFVGMALLFAMIVGLGLSYVFKSHFENHVRPHLVQYLEYVQHDIGMPPNRQRAKTLADKLNIQIQIIDDRGAWSSHNELVELDNLKVEHRIVENGKEYIFAKGNHREYFLTHQENVTLLFDVPNVRQGKKGFRSFIPIGVVLLTLLLLYFATRRLFFPLTTIQAGVKRFAAGDLDHRISVNRRDELGDLANSVNAMASEIQQMLDAKRQLLLAISHELRTPLTRAKVALELLDETSLKKQLGDDIKA
ncbi:HAMP domain-containing protein, partial [Pseudomonadota bacterium]